MVPTNWLWVPTDWLWVPTVAWSAQAVAKRAATRASEEPHPADPLQEVLEMETRLAAHMEKLFVQKVSGVCGSHPPISTGLTVLRLLAELNRRFRHSTTLTARRHRDHNHR